ncbi:MAG TPA: hypothetical protein PLD49_08270 [Thermoclostridium caenicola]|uniref:DUF881 domain-containing protein n=1 Tax=Thermoclostridium caenicola TaxID=659425 RepID=A0A1M6GDJ7_9FIRM|nr:hypothetical protein [Thermoclostridium caenicola]SHJ08031.1 hypothetical protein SAMN05444373_102316 [Thermoclostridium caenicola]HOK43645.1 hypothetical protein [Thermoclostridium caenicola]HOL84361.1 hypothetical protein [Thermoclostridium caenicola]HPO76493.1 hypothetical protein [Thermoclostridium caenicola]
MNQTRGRIAYLLFAVLFLLVAVIFSQAAGEPGSSSDPLVTKSYVDQQIAQLAAKINSSSGGSSSGNVNNATVEQLKADVGDLTRFVVDALSGLQELKDRVAVIENGFTVISLKKGQTLVLGGGSEVILRSGQATAISGESGTLVDVSAGKDLNNGVSVPVQHLIIAPKGDGRGLKITADAYLIVRGGYTIK